MQQLTIFLLQKKCQDEWYQGIEVLLQYFCTVRDQFAHFVLGQDYDELMIKNRGLKLAYNCPMVKIKDRGLTSYGQN